MFQKLKHYNAYNIEFSNLCLIKYTLLIEKSRNIAVFLLTFYFQKHILNYMMDFTL